MSSRPHQTPTDRDVDAEVDVAIVGYGPVGQALAALLGRAGHRVAAFERFHEIYRLPRAVHLDHEIMRLLQALGLAEASADEMVPAARVPLVRRRRRAPDDLDATAAGALGLGAGLHVLPARARACPRRVRVTRRRRHRPSRLGRRGARRGRGDGATLTVRRHARGRAGPADADRRDADGPGALGRRRRRRQLVRPRAGRHHPSRPRLPGALAGRRRRAARHGRARRPAGRVPVVRPRAARPPTSRAARGTGAGSSCCLPGETPEDFDDPDARVVAARAVVPAGGRPTDPQRGLRVPLDARRARCARGAFCWSATPPT